MELSEYQYIFQHIPGKQNILANYLSRTPTKNNCTDIAEEPNLIHEEVLPIVECENRNSNKNQWYNALNDKEERKLDIEIEEIVQAQKEDKLIKTIIADLQKYGTNTRKFKNYTICTKTNLLLFIAKPNKFNKKTIFKIVIPHKLKGKMHENKSLDTFWD